MFVSVAIDLALDRLFTYKVPVELLGRVRVGQLLRVPFHGRIARGFALSLTETPPAFSTKPVMAVEDESPFFSPELLKLVKWIASYTASPIEIVLKTAVPASVLKPSARPKELLYVEPTGTVAELTKHQAELLADIVRVGGGWMQQLVKEFRTSPSTPSSSLRAAKTRPLILHRESRYMSPFALTSPFAVQPEPWNQP